MKKTQVAARTYPFQSSLVPARISKNVTTLQTIHSKGTFSDDHPPSFRVRGGFLCSCGNSELLGTGHETVLSQNRSE